MEKIPFSKYHGTGNDFIIINYNKLNSNSYLLNDKYRNVAIAKLTERRFGIGADGVIIIKEDTETPNNTDFEMIYYNPDGSQSFCGNGSRCAVMYAWESSIITEKNCKFMAYDGIHEASINDANIELKMNNVNEIKKYNESLFINTGSPHHIQWVDDVNIINVEKEGKQICNSERYLPEGANVNFVRYIECNKLEIRTFERGVNKETFSCGTGVTASAIAASTKYQLKESIMVRTKGGELQVKFNQISPKQYSSVYLIGNAVKVFDGVTKIKLN